MGMHVLTDAEAPPLSEYTPIQLRPFQTNVVETLQHENGNDVHLSIDCALFKMFPLDVSHEVRGNRTQARLKNALDGYHSCMSLQQTSRLTVTDGSSNVAV